jgi:uncharacterized protein YbcI
MTYTKEIDVQCETSVQQDQKVIHVQIDGQQVFQLPITDNSVVTICFGSAVGNQTAEQKFPRKFQELAQRYSKEVEDLASSGYANQRLVLRLLHRCGGNVNQVEQILLKKRDNQQKFPQTRKYNGDLKRAENPRQCWKKMRQAPKSTQEDVRSYSAEVEILVAKGFNRCLVSRLLNKFEGNVDQVEQILLKKREKQKCKLHAQDPAQDYANEIEILASKGFTNSRLVARLLNKFNGNLDQVEQFLLKKQQNKLSKNSRAQEPAQCYSDEIKVLASKGFENTVVIVRLLNKHDGDVTVVEQILMKKRAGVKKCELYPQELSLLAQRGFLHPRKNFIALRKFDGDVEKACAWLATKSC